MRASLLSCVAAWLLAAPALAAPVTVELREESFVAGAEFTLGEIGEVRASVGDSALAGLVIGRSPRVGAALHVRRAEVERTLLQLAPQLRGALRLAGPERIVVLRGPLQSVEVPRLRESAEHDLRTALAGRYARHEIVALPDEAQTIAVPQGRVEVRSRLPVLAPPGARTVVWTDVYVDGRVYRSVPFAFRVQAWDTVLAARRPLDAGEVLKAGDFEPREAQVAGAPGAPFPPSVDPAGLRLKRALAEGAALGGADVGRAPGVTRDQPVRVRLAVGAIGVETIGIATRDAAAGEVLRVRDAASKQTYPARVVSAGLVEALWR
jgi:flagella basal body P-ring formation protein FlgA